MQLWHIAHSLAFFNLIWHTDSALCRCTWWGCLEHCQYSRGWRNTWRSDLPLKFSCLQILQVSITNIRCQYLLPVNSMHLLIKVITCHTFWAPHVKQGLNFWKKYFFSFPFPFLFLFLFIFGVFFLTQPREKWLCNGKTYNFSLIHLLSENHYCCCSKQQCSIKLNCWKVFKFEIYPGLFQINMELIHITIGTTFIIFITD
jgi:hypothetical protein